MSKHPEQWATLPKHGHCHLYVRANNGGLYCQTHERYIKFGEVGVA